MGTNEEKSGAQFLHLLRADPRLLAEMQRICHESVERDRIAESEREAARVVRNAKRVAAEIVRCNDARLGLAPMPVHTTKLAERIIQADKRRRGE